MKSIITPLMLFLSLFLHQSANAYSQGISLSVKEAPLDKVFSLIQKQTKYVLVYVQQQMKGTKKVTVNVTNERIEKVLDLVLGDQPLSYSIDENYIVIGPKIKTSSSSNNFEEITAAPIELTGKVINEKGEPVVGATVMVKGTDIVTTTGNDGYFTIKAVDNKAILTITSVGYEPRIVKITSDRIEIKMIVSAQTIKEVIVTGNNGYQILDKDHPGAVDVVSKDLLNRRVSSNVLDRIENLTTGLSFNTPNERTSDNPNGILIRGRNSIFSSVAPLIVLDNFPYDGDLNNINPNDVESITILKDAAAAAQWGAKAANGVIVITTKKGRSGKPQISINSNITLEGKPGLNNIPIISSSSEIEVEKWLFGKGYYDGSIDDIYTNPPLSPVQEILLKERKGEISEYQAENEIESLKRINYRDDLKKYFYRVGSVLQNSINVSGSTPILNYYFSGGWDKSSSKMIGTSDNRFTIRNQNTFKVNKSFQIDAGINYVSSISKAGNNPGIYISPGAGKGLYPYADLVNDKGEGNVLVKDYRASFIDTLGGGNLLDWKYKPYEEIGYTQSSLRISDFILNTGFRFQISKDLNTELKYQFENSTSISEYINNVESYFSRNLINQFYQPDASNKFPIPIGGIASFSNSSLLSHQGRAQINYTHLFGNSDHKLNAYGGVELKSVLRKGNSSTAYGYSRKGSIVNNKMNFDELYTIFPTYYTGPITSYIPNNQSISEQLDRFVSLYLSGLYSFRDKFFVSASARKDAANLFGVKTNQKGVPLWSVGLNWKISNESFYALDLLPILNFRITYGSGGNYSRLVSALTTATYRPNIFGALAATIITPPNDKLRWEKVYTFNMGFDFNTKGGRIGGSVDFYKKRNVDLLGTGPVDPTAGLTQGNGVAYFFGNLASMKGHGFEVNINSNNLVGEFAWQTNLLFSYAQTKVTQYLLPPPTDPTSYIGGQSPTPLIGKPIFNHYGFRWEGLDKNNGDPQGFIGGKVSKDYSSILSKTAVDSLVYAGPAQPPYFGAIRNTVSWKSISISFNISYKLGYYFRRNSISYNGLYNTWTGHHDFENRWQQPGDENKTQVPSQVYIDYHQFAQRDNFYQNSEILLVKGDHIRFEDIGLSYAIDKKALKRMPFSKVRIYGYINNINWLLWKENHVGLDPIIQEGIKPGKTFSLGVNVDF